MSDQPFGIESEYLTFTEAIPVHRLATKVWRVNSLRQGTLLGIVAWYGPWRQYCFYPEDATIFNKGCLNDINNLIGLAMAERNRERKKAKA